MFIKDNFQRLKETHHNNHHHLKNIYMKILQFLFLFLPIFAFSQSTERISAHLFDLPEGVSLVEFTADISKLNAIYEKNGLGKDRYKIYSVKEDDEAENYRLLWISTWESDDEYESAHSEEIQRMFEDHFAPIYQEILDNEIYRKVFLVE